MNNTDYPIGADNSSAPWNETPMKKLVSIKIFCETDVLIEVNVNEDGQVYSDERDKIDNVCEDIIRNSSERLSYIDWDFIEDEKFEK